MSLPAEVVEYQIAHADDDRLPAVVVAIAVCYSAAVISVVLRLISRRLVKASLQGDDWLILVALVGLSSQLTAGVNGLMSTADLDDGIHRVHWLM
jgi:uncharacterized membrane protein YhaH (DUF805 family)